MMNRRLFHAAAVILCVLLTGGVFAQSDFRAWSDPLVISAYSDGQPNALLLYDLNRSPALIPLVSEESLDSFAVDIHGTVAYTLNRAARAELWMIDLTTQDLIPVSVAEWDDAAVIPLAWSTRGQLALSVIPNNSEDVHLMVWDDTLHDIASVEIPPWGDYGLSWSFDGRLAYRARGEDGTFHQFVWGDDDVTIDITPTDITMESRYYYPIWSADGRLAFTVDYRVPSIEGVDRVYSGEVYVWDGTNLTNISQSPDRHEYPSTWSNDGRLAFLSSTLDYQDYALFVWDGEQPERLETGLTPDNRGSVPEWLPDNRLAFFGIYPASVYFQTYVWDGETVVNISRTPDSNTTGIYSAATGWWAFITGHGNELFVRDDEGQILLDTNIENSLAWSADGALMFCTLDYDAFEWTLNVWRQDNAVEEIVHGGIYSAQWVSGGKVNCFWR